MSYEDNNEIFIMNWTNNKNNSEHTNLKNLPLKRKVKMANKVECTSQSENKSKLHTVTRPVLIICRCIGLFPVSGLFSSTPKKLRTTLKSPYTIICLACLAGQLGLGLLALAYIISSGISVRVVHKFLVLFGGTICTLIVQKLAWNWPKLMQEVTAIEKCLTNFSHKNTARHCKAAAVVMFTCSFVDSFLSIRFYGKIADACSANSTATAYYYKYTMPAFNVVIPYSTVTFILMQFLFYQSIFVATFADLLIIIISIYLTSYFEEFNEMVVVYKDKYPGIWSVLRVHFTKLTRLCKVIDDRINIFVLFSFGSNLSISCVLLFKILRKDLAHSFTSECDEKKVHETLQSYDRAMYFAFSIIFLLSKTLVTALYASKVHSTAREPIMTLYDVPSTSFNSETRRLVEQLHGSTIALSGLHFFYVTRGMILSMITAIFTYELVMLQFSQ